MKHTARPRSNYPYHPFDRCSFVQGQCAEPCEAKQRKRKDRCEMAAPMLCIQHGVLHNNRLCYQRSQQCGSKRPHFGFFNTQALGGSCNDTDTLRGDTCAAF